MARVKVCLLVTVLVAVCGLRTDAGSERKKSIFDQASKSALEVRVNEAFGRMPLYFIENGGQVDGDAPVYLVGSRTTALFTPEGVRFTMRSISEPDGQTAHLTPVSFGFSPEPEKRLDHSFSLDFLDANPNVRPEGKDETSAIVSYFTGPRERWKTGLKTFSQVVYSELWPGIDLVYSGAGNRLKYTFLVKPGADPAQIRLAYRGVDEVLLSDRGDLEISTPTGKFFDEKPYVYQERAKTRLEVSSSYDLKQSGPSEYGFGFQLGSYDPSLPLIVDPGSFVYAGYIGGTGRDRGLGIAVNNLGEAFVTGRIVNGPTGFDILVAKVNSAGTALVYFSFIGGVGSDEGFDIDIDFIGNAYVTGATNSTQASFPVFVGPDLTYNGGGSDAFVAKVNATGTALIYCGYIGGAGVDFAEGIVVDSFRAAYLTGVTNSAANSFPAKVGPDLTINGAFDAFIAKIKPVPNLPAVRDNLQYAGYIGGNLDDVFNVGGFLSSGHVAIDGAGNAYVSGLTKSGGASFPTGTGFGALPTWDNTYNGGLYDAFVVKVNAGGTALVYAGYIGGNGDDEGFGMAVDSFGNAYLTGYTESTEATFPETMGPDLTYNGGGDAFVAKIDSSGTFLVYCGYLGGAGVDVGWGVTIDGSANLYVIGHTHSPEATFPVVLGPDLTFNGILPEFGDAYVTKIKPTPNDPVVTNNLEYSGYIGGSGEDSAYWVAVDGAGAAYVVGDTRSNQATFPNGSGFGGLPGPDQTFNGQQDAFVVKISN